MNKTVAFCMVVVMVLLVGCSQSSIPTDEVSKEKNTAAAELSNQGERGTQSGEREITSTDLDQNMGTTPQVSDQNNDIQEKLQEWTDPEIEGLLNKYGLHLAGNKIHTQVIRIPDTFKVGPGEFPEGLYWAYNNELSKDIGMDILAYRGMEVTAYFSEIKERMPESLDWPGRAVVIKYDNRIIGAWLDVNYFLCSLKGNYFGDLVKKDWGHWLLDEGIESNDDKFEQEIKGLSPIQIFQKYIDAVNNKGYKKAYSLFSMRELIGHLFMRQEDKLYNDGWDPYGMGLSNILSYKLKTIKEFSRPGNPPETPDRYYNERPYDRKIYLFEAELKLKKETGTDNPCFVHFVRETSDSPWQISGFSTGP